MRDNGHQLIGLLAIVCVAWVVAVLLAATCAKPASAEDVHVLPDTFQVLRLDGHQTQCDCQDHQQWHLDMVRARAAWATTTGLQSLKVGVISSGIDTAGGDFGTYLDGTPMPGHNYWLNPGETYNGLDDDANGYIDDVRGFDFATLTPLVFDAWGTGTGLAGVLAAEGPAMGYRGVGIAQNLTIVPVKWFTGGLAGNGASEVAAVRYARNVGCKIIIGHGGTNSVYQPMKDEIALNTAAGVLTIWSAGGLTAGGNIDQCAEPCTLSGTAYPSKYADPGLLVVTGCALTNGFGFQDASVQSNVNWGPVSVDLAAPTRNANTLPNPPGPLPDPLRNVLTVGPGEHWVAWSGSTSAVAMVAGAAALVWSANPSLTAAQVKAAIMGSVDTYPGLAGKCVTGGMLNAQAALAAAGGGAPVSVEAKAPPYIPGSYDVQGRRIDPAAGRSGVTFSRKGKRATVK